MSTMLTTTRMRRVNTIALPRAVPLVSNQMKQANEGLKKLHGSSLFARSSEEITANQAGVFQRDSNAPASAGEEER